MIDTDESDFDEDVFGLSDDEKEEEWAPPPPPPEKKPLSNNVLRFRQALGLDEPREEENEKDGQKPGEKRIETLASRVKKNAPPPEVVVFNAKSSSTSKQPKFSRKKPGQTEEEEKPADLRRLKNDVYRFGVQGFEKSQRDSAMEDLLCSLGAKPKRKECKNYKDFKQQRRTEKEASKRAKAEGTHYSSTLVSRVGGVRKNKHKKDRNKVAGFDAQPGKFRDGVQFVKQRDFKRGGK